MIFKINEHVVFQKYAVIFGRIKKFKFEKKKHDSFAIAENNRMNFQIENENILTAEKLNVFFLVRLEEKMTAKFDI